MTFRQTASPLPHPTMLYEPKVEISFVSFKFYSEETVFIIRFSIASILVYNFLS